MTEQDLIDLGFERVDVTAPESGKPQDWYYYIYHLDKTLCLISSCNDEVKKDDWFVEFFVVGSIIPLQVFEVDDIRFTSYKQLARLIHLIESAKQ
jgi:hypothetical protein